MIPWTAHTRLPCPSLSPTHCSNSCPLSWWCHPTISSSVVPFPSCPQSFPASGPFPFKTIQGYPLSWQQYSSLYLRAIHQKGGCPKKNLGASLVAQMVKNLPAMQEAGFNPWVGKILWRSTWQPTPVFLPGESPWREEPSRLQTTGSQRVRHDWVTKHTHKRRWLRERDVVQSISKCPL